MVADASVRAAGPDDVTAIARVQAAAWQADYAGLLPADVLADLDSPAAQEQWRRAVTDPPTPRHRVLVALTGTGIVGFAAFGPSADPDLGASLEAEVAALCVTPQHTGAGHGSRLVNATVDHLRGDGFLHASVWLAATGAGDDRLHRFLTDAGWAEDGAHRALDLYGDASLVVPQVRLRAAIGPEA